MPSSRTGTPTPPPSPPPQRHTAAALYNVTTRRFRSFCDTNHSPYSYPTATSRAETCSTTYDATGRHALPDEVSPAQLDALATTTVSPSDIPDEITRLPETPTASHYEYWNRTITQLEEEHENRQGTASSASLRRGTSGSSDGSPGRRDMLLGEDLLDDDEEEEGDEDEQQLGGERRSWRQRWPEMQCCCGRPTCAFLEHNNVALGGLEKDLETAAQLGQVCSLL